ncbi:hypothetical protein KM868_09995 [Micrococcus luteus]|uniref:hypothetical protein n=1 Tax=Micrococcus luteus TaxID=1270 RepID=UPI00128C8B33|nr:hypothetical protein [Micrococcus luteus]HAJ9499871.1 hypothetical protein [Listeria monocytogenes]MBU8763827.1 hypothetical protein [Micrococcus luteus]MCV7495909.1 hypothetical protein [Micrococcus luteus]MCV7508950.1 hypothetical protein [Micrococcus luteus]MCV7615695.1 hypothetical protein [Micrococcus luteus]
MIHPATLIQRLRENEAGASSIASALITPVALLLVLAVPQAGAYYQASTVAQAAANAAYSASRLMEGSAAEGRQAAQQVLAQHEGSLRGAEVSISASGDRMTVTVSGTAPTFTGEWLSPPVTRSITGPVEKVVR